MQLKYFTSFLVCFLLLITLPSGRPAKIQPNLDYDLQWDVINETITWEITVKTKGFIGFGISPNGAMLGADIVTSGVHPNGQPYLHDRHGTGNNLPPLDDHADYELLGAKENASHTMVRFSRKLNTCDDDNDIPITTSTQKMIWSFGETDEISYHGLNRGVVSVNFLDSPPEIPDISKYKTWRVFDTFTLTGNDTTYWCKFHKAPVLTNKHHIIGYEAYLKNPDSQRHTHHMDIYKCVAPKGKDPNEIFGKYVGGEGYDCYYSEKYFPVEYCLLFEAQWSIGGQATWFPAEVGLPFGEQEDVYYMTEMHFDNPQKVNSVVESGLDFYYTDQLRSIDAGFLVIGATASKAYSLTLPPNSEDFIVSSHCHSGCTKYLPEEGISAYVYLLHSHLSGRKMKLRHFRGTEELPWIANDLNYNFNYQTNRPIKHHLKIMPEDHITLECTYDTTWKKGQVTLGGRSSRDEMCLTFIMYYPRTLSVNQCGSDFPQSSMLSFMGIQNVSLPRREIDPTILEPEHLKGKKYSAVVESMDWTLEDRARLQSLTRFGVHDSYCNPVEGEHPSFPVSYPPQFTEYIPEDEHC